LKRGFEVKKILFATMAVLGLLSGSETSQAAFVYRMDLDIDQLGIQSTRSLEVGVSFTAQLVMDITNPSSLAIYHLSTSFSPSVLSASSPVNLFPAVAGWSSFAAPSLSVPGQIRQITGDGPSITSFSAPIARFNFTATAEGVSTIQPFLLPQPSDDFIIDGITFDVADPAQISFASGTVTVTAVPEPSSLATMSIVAAAAVFARRRWSRTKKNQS
jgi:hypothetical protein